MIHEGLQRGVLFAPATGSAPLGEITPRAGSGILGVGAASFEAEGVTLYHCDCMELMRRIPDKAFDLAIADPPYGIGAGKKKQYHAGALTAYEPKPWDAVIPSAEYFAELRRVSRHQIIFGANYFTQHLPAAKNWIVWDKMQPEGVSFSMHELAYYSGDGQAKICRKYNGGNRVANNDEKAQKYIRIHPTQKPVELYAWVLANYAEPGQTLLDTHLGSGSIAIAARAYGCPLVACEIDADYLTAAIERITRDFAQGVFSLGGGGGSSPKPSAADVELERRVNEGVPGVGGDSLPAAVKRLLKKRRKRNTTWIVSATYPPVLPRPERINHIGCSGGKDSTALLLWALFESGYQRESLDVSFCDTGGGGGVSSSDVSMNPKSPTESSSPTGSAPETV